MKTEQFYNKNQFLIKNNGKVIFQSYDSTIAISENNTLTLGKDWDYSRTTLKHLYLFINDYVNDYEIEQVKDKANKKAYIQYLIDNQFIKYDDNLI